MNMLYVLVLATFIGLGVVTRVSRLLHTPLMSLTNAISAIAVVGSLVITGQDHPPFIRLMGAVALAASMTNIDRDMLVAGDVVSVRCDAFAGDGGEASANAELLLEHVGS